MKETSSHGNFTKLAGPPTFLFAESKILAALSFSSVTQCFFPFISKHHNNNHLSSSQLPPFFQFRQKHKCHTLTPRCKAPNPIFSCLLESRNELLNPPISRPFRRFKLENMRPKTHRPSNLKLLTVGVFLAFLLLFVLRSSFSSSNPDAFLPKDQKIVIGRAENCSGTCTKIPPSLSQALIHYTTSTITPQQTLKEIKVTSRVLQKKSPCNFLVFGLGHDSLMWATLNHGGRTIFLEEDAAWIEQIRRRFPMLESYHVTYDSRVNQADELLEVGKGPECTAIVDARYSICQLALKGLPSEVYNIEWDLIMVDAPTGFHDEAPGRMTAIYTAGMMARNRGSGETDVFVHDVNREVEDKFSREFLCEGYMKKQEGRLRHFTIPSHRDGMERPFCPL